jgi:hypothetical protein
MASPKIKHPAAEASKTSGNRRWHHGESHNASASSSPSPFYRCAPAIKRGPAGLARITAKRIARIVACDLVATGRLWSRRR